MRSRQETCKSTSTPASRRSRCAIASALIRERAIGDGGRLVLRTVGTIELLAADGTVTQSWGPEEAEWGTYAFRFGIRLQARTMAPRGPDTASAKPGF